MKKTYIRSQIYFLVFTITFLNSCKGQENNETKESPNQEILLGTVVEKIPNSIWQVFQDKNNAYWFGSNGEGAFKYDGINLIQYTVEDGLVSNSIRGFQQDTTGRLFIETASGVSTFNGTSFTTLVPSDSVSNSWRLTPDDLWFNCNGNNLYRYDGENLYELQLPQKDLEKAFGQEVTGVSFKDMNNSPYAVYGIDKDKKGNLWLGTVTAGVFRYDGTSFLWIAEQELSTLPDGRVPGVRSMLEDKNGYFWLSNFISKYRIIETNGLATYEKFEGVATSSGYFEERLGYFNSGLVATNGDIWMTTYGGGAWKYDGEKLINFPVLEGETEVLLVSIYQDRQNVLWLGTDNAGVYRFNGKIFIKGVQ